MVDTLLKKYGNETVLNPELATTIRTEYDRTRPQAIEDAKYADLKEEFDRHENTLIDGLSKRKIGDSLFALKELRSLYAHHGILPGKKSPGKYEMLAHLDDVGEFIEHVASEKKTVWS